MDKNEWFIPIEKAYSELKARFDALELNKNLDDTRRNEELLKIISDWGAIS